LTVGAPFAGLGRNPWGGEDHWHTPLPIALGSRFQKWPAAVPGVAVEVFVTGGDDPVMRRFAGHDPADRRVLPSRVLVRKLPAELDHNLALGWVCRHYVALPGAAQPSLRLADPPPSRPTRPKRLIK
jgi:hypothetical protein